VVDTVRALFAQQPVGADVWVALAWLLGILAVAYGVAASSCQATGTASCGAVARHARSASRRRGSPTNAG